MAPRPGFRIELFDEGRGQWRDFAVVPEQEAFKPECRGTLHQFAPFAVTCACGKIRRNS